MMEGHWKTHRVVHLGWIIAVLTSFIVFQASSQFGTNPAIKDIISFAVSFASLILAVVAIIQSLLSGYSASETLGSISSAARMQEDSAIQVGATVKQVTAQVGKIDTELSGLMSSLLTLSTDISENSRGLVSTASELRERQVEILSSKRSETVAIPNSDEEAIKVVLDSFSNELSIGSLSALYLAVISYDKGREFDLEAIEKNEYIAGLCYGSLSCFGSMG